MKNLVIEKVEKGLIIKVEKIGRFRWIPNLPCIWFAD